MLTATFHSHSWVFKNEYRYNSYLKMSVKRPLSCSWVLCFCGQVLYRVFCFCGQVLYRVLCFCGQVLYRVLCFCGQMIYRVLCFCGQVIYRVLCFCGQVLHMCICHLMYRENFMSKIWDNWEERMLQIPSISHNQVTTTTGLHKLKFKCHLKLNWHFKLHEINLHFRVNWELNLIEVCTTQFRTPNR